MLCQGGELPLSLHHIQFEITQKFFFFAARSALAVGPRSPAPPLHPVLPAVQLRSPRCGTHPAGAHHQRLGLLDRRSFTGSHQRLLQLVGDDVLSEDR